MKKYTPLFAGLIMAAVCAVIAWAGGYNFDHRGAKVAAGIGATVGASSFAALWAAIFDWRNGRREQFRGVVGPNLR